MDGVTRRMYGVTHRMTHVCYLFVCLFLILCFVVVIVVVVVVVVLYYVHQTKSIFKGR